MANRFGWPKIEERVAGLVDGANTLFETEKVYRGGTLIAYRNGQALEQTMENGWDELGGKLFRMKVAPMQKDVIGAYYIIDET